MPSKKNSALATRNFNKNHFTILLQRRILWYVLIAVALGFFQKLLLDRLTLFGTKPDVMLLLTVWIARREGGSIGTSAGFFIGLIMDLLQGTLGLESFAKTVSGFVAGFFSNSDDAEKVGYLFLSIGLAAFFGTAARELLGSALQVPLWKWTTASLVSALFNSILGILFFGVNKRFE